MRKLFALLLAVLMLAGLATVAFASDNPSAEAEKEFKIDIIYHVDPAVYETVVVKAGESYTFTPRDFEGYTFDHYEIHGEFTQGKRAPSTTTTFDTKDPNTIVPQEDLVIDVYYTKEAAQPAPEPAAEPRDTGSTSPKTADPSVILYAALAFSACGGAVAVKKLRRD